MRRSARGLTLVVSLSLALPTAALMSPEVAWAQAKRSIREALPLEARGHWDAGVVLAQKKLWNEARGSFKSAYELSKNPRVLFNIAVCERELGHWASALETLRRELAEGKNQLTREEEASLSASIASLEKLVAELSIDVSEKDADVYIDNDKVDPQKLPGPFVVQLGERRVRAVKPGFLEAVESIELAAGGKGRVTLKLQPILRTTRVNVAVVGPAKAIVKIDGKEVGPAPYAGQVAVSSEPHQVSAEALGFVSATQSVVVKEGEPLNLTLQLAPEQQKGKLVVLARPEGAEIELDGTFVGASRWEGPVDARTHQVVVKKRGYYTWSHDVDVPKGGERTVSAALNEDRNTSFVPWLIGSLVVGAAVSVGVFLVARQPDEEPAPGTYSPYKIPTSSFHPSLSF